MLTVPGAKLVRRDQLESASSSSRSTPDAELESRLRLHIHNDFTFADLTDAVASDQEDETELRLFAAPAHAAATIQKVRLSSPGAANADPGFTVKKPRAYYFADPPTASEQRALQAAAIHGNTVLELSKSPWPGCALPWKVSHTTATGLKKQVLVGQPPSLATVEDAVYKKARKGKKTRIAIRKKRLASKEKREEQAWLAKEKEEAEREKRTQRNREKKVKRKAREQAKKQQGAVETTTEPAEATQRHIMEE